jgi:riboflavin kinase/FMN adenylyltransferase
MKVIRNLLSLESEIPYPVLTIGAFDGIHLGHQEIIRRVVGRSRERRGTSVLLTFRDHPQKVLDPPHAPFLITPPGVKEEILRGMGLDLLIQVPFSQTWASMEARSFVEEIVVGKLSTKELWVGFDFAFGKDRRGTLQELRAWGKELGFSVNVVPAVTIQGEVVSSTRVRGLLLQGRVAEACSLLGHPYIVRGRVGPGSGRGRELGFPTANLKPSRDFLLPDGVYAGFAKFAGRIYEAAINIGKGPTLTGVNRRIEVHLFDFQGDLYRRQLEVHFWEKIREERKFSGEQELIDQIRQDILRIGDILSGAGARSSVMALQGSTNVVKNESGDCKR